MSALASNEDTSSGEKKWVEPPRGTLEVSNFSARYETVGDLKGNFGRFGGQFIPETLMHAHKYVYSLCLRCLEVAGFPGARQRRPRAAATASNYWRMCRLPHIH